MKLPFHSTTSPDAVSKDSIAVPWLALVVVAAFVGVTLCDVPTIGRCLMHFCLGEQIAVTLSCATPIVLHQLPPCRRSSKLGSPDCRSCVAPVTAAMIIEFR